MGFVTISVKCAPELIEVLIAALFEAGFDSFQEFDDGFDASCEKKVFDKNRINEIIGQFPKLHYELKTEEKINWNEEWEKNYDPIIIDHRCIVRASFHKPQPSFPYEIIITPKMSFGTGHHATTYQVLAYQLAADHTGKKILDVGTGTGILSIMAYKRGAVRLVATDIDDWCIENSKENFALNDVKGVTLIQGQISEVKDEGFDMVIANINKNVLLDQLGQYAAKLVMGGQMILSGFYEKDLKDLIVAAEQHGLKKLINTAKDQWAMLVLEKRLV